jgi:hypothetical protein
MPSEERPFREESGDIKPPQGSKVKKGAFAEWWAEYCRKMEHSAKKTRAEVTLHRHTKR